MKTYLYSHQHNRIISDTEGFFWFFVLKIVLLNSFIFDLEKPVS